MDSNPRDEETALPVIPRAERSRTSVPSLLFISSFIVLYLLTSHNGDEFLARHHYQDALQSLTFHLSNYSAWMNGTTSNFTMPIRDATISPLLDKFHIQGRVLDPNVESYYPNITGYIHGDATFNNLTLSALQQNQSLAQQLMKGVNVTDMESRLGSWKWNTTTKISLSVMEKRPPDSKAFDWSSFSLIHGRMELSELSESDDLKLEFEGIHFISDGSIFGIAETPGRQIDIRLLPSLVPEEVNDLTAKMIQPELHARIEKLKNLIDSGVVDSEKVESDDKQQTSCPFTFFAKINSVPVPEYLMKELEDELQNPTGIKTVSPRGPSINGILVSRECGVLYEISNTEGLRSIAFLRKVTTYAGLTALGYLFMLFLFVRQAKVTRTASGVLRVSRWTFLAQTTMDCVSFAGHITFAILAEGRTSLSLVAPAFLACILFTSQAQLSALIYQIQGPEAQAPLAAGRPQTQNTAGTPPPSGLPTSVPTGTPALNLTPTTQQPTTIIQAANNSPPTSFLAFFIHHIRTDPQARMWLTLIIFLTFIVRVIMSPLLSLIFVASTYCAIWTPQIVRSVRRGRSSGLSNSYILGTTTCRLLSAIYFLGCPGNVLEVDPRSWVWLLALFVYLQAFVVILQEALGPAFFLPGKFTETKSYNYHPHMPRPTNPEQSLGDCAICMEAIFVDPPLSGRSSSLDLEDRRSEKGLSVPLLAGDKYSASNLLNRIMGLFTASKARKNYSLAPCCHLFHTECLEKWLVIKYICPQCRRSLPPL